MPETNSNPEAILSLLREASASIMEVYRSSDYHTKNKPDNSPVTRADLQSERIIKSGLAILTPSIPVISEESVADPLAPDRLPDDCWICDPLDGTREFIKKNGEFCICLARLSSGSVTEGYIFSPPSGILWYAIKGSGAYRLAGDITRKLPCDESAGPIRVLRSRSHSTIEEEEWISSLGMKQSLAEELQGSAVKFGRLADGSGDLYIKFSTIFKWDVAAGVLLVEESGGTVISLATRKRLKISLSGYKVDPFIASGYRIKGLPDLLKTLPIY